MMIVIGASEAGAALGVDEHVTPAALYHRKVSDTDKPEESEATFLGNMLEDGVAKQFAKRHNVDVVSWPTMFSSSHPWLRATPDRVIFPDDMSATFRDRFDIAQDEVVLLEIKTTGLATPSSAERFEVQWGKPMTDDIPRRYLVQVMVQAYVMNENLAATGSDLYVRTVIVCALIPGRGCVDFVVRIPHGGIDIVTALSAWHHRHLTLLVPPPPETEDDWESHAKAVTLPMTQNTVTRVLSTSSIGKLAIQWRDATAAEKVAAQSKGAARAGLIIAIGNGYGLEIVDPEGVTLGKVTLTAPGEAGAPVLSKTAFADAVVGELVSERLTGRSPFADKLWRMAVRFTRPKYTGRQLRPYWNKGKKP